MIYKFSSIIFNLNKLWLFFKNRSKNKNDNNKNNNHVFHDISINCHYRFNRFIDKFAYFSWIYSG